MGSARSIWVAIHTVGSYGLCALVVIHLLLHWSSIAAAVRIPYDPARYLAETDETMRRYYACHCPFVREAILRGEIDISANWCYCSGGFVKYPYEVILGRELRVDLLQSVLKGDSICRFAIHLDDAK